jgi:class 3 adenylate cyclase
MAHSAHSPAAVWFAEVVGYSELAGQHESAAMALVESLQAVARASVPVLGGRIVKFIRRRDES